MKIGFLGTGAIASAMVTGLSSAGGEAHSILLSPRNAAIAADLAHRFPQVSVASSNQEVVDECTIVVVAVRPQIAQSVLSELRFRAGQSVISLVSGYSLQRVRTLASPASRVTRAVPLPSAAQRRSPTAIHPPDRVTAEIFDSLGTAFAVDSETEFDALCSATATMATYFAFADGVASWLTRQGIPETIARDYIARILSGLAHATAEAPERSFPSLAADHATRGGTNQQVLTSLREHGVFDHLSEALDAVMRRVTASTSIPIDS
ncbi:NADP oxidoreductase coenzyme F420-dependent [Candidatus Sulfopaludibacter sp. SbA3]|nr:NADP oxidoreductase coenzyme F420-dependent [Candidatus Sulfopaludibacter sp. SbA3]